MKQAAIIGSPTLHQNYRNALENLSCKAVILSDCSHIKKHPDAFDGLLLPGGGDVFSSIDKYTAFFRASECSSSFSDTHVISSAVTHVGASAPDAGSFDTHPDLEQLRALHLFYKMNKPIFGICKGMQLINLYFHGTIREVSTPNLHQDPEKDLFHPADNLPGSFLHALFGPHMLVNSSHHQCIDTLGKDLQIIQHASDKTPEAISHLFAPVIGTQWHPERMPKLPRQDAGLLFQYFISLL